MLRKWRRSTYVSGLFAAAVLASGCADSATGPDAGGPQGEFVITANVVGTPVSTLVVEVSAADITRPLAFNIEVSNNVATGTIRIPPGEDRTITVQAFDNLGQVTHEGSATVDVRPGQNPTVSVPMVSRAGQVPIEVVIGSVSITVTPSSGDIAVGGTLQLTATITAPNGATLAGPAEFATLSPTIARVDASGLVTAVAEGSVQIIASYAGVGAAATITVGPGSGGGGSGPRLAVAGGNTLSLYDLANLNQVGAFALPVEGLSVASSGNGLVYVGTMTGQILSVDLATATIATVAVVPTEIYGLTLRNGMLYASGSSLPETRVVSVNGVGLGSVPSPFGENLRSTAFGPDGRFYLTAFTPFSGAGPVTLYDANLFPLLHFGEGSGLTSAFGIDTRSNGTVVVADQNLSRYFVFHPDGGFQGSAPVACIGQLRNLAIDSGDNTWIACFGSNAVVKIDPNGNELARINVASPSGVAVF